ncbi:MAG TPA: alpha/beta fold hydrolase [Candidatus Binatus sp.]|nr:alpha/beta fold hydrolase [Candidatus Binatus sp.]
MKLIRASSLAIFSVVFFMTHLSIWAADYPAPKQGSWTVRDFRFHTGEALPELRLSYVTVGDPMGEPVLILHGTGSAGTNFLNNNFAGELFGPGQPLDAKRYFIIIPDAIGAGKSSKPSDGLRTNFPRYNSDDLVRAQHRLVTEHLAVQRLRLVLGQSGGGMLTWVWGTMFPDFMDALVPMSCMPVELSDRNWMTRRMMIEMIRSDPEWNGGNYTKQPRSLQWAQTFFSIVTSGGTQALHKAAPTREKADQLVNQRLAQTSRTDANDVIYQYESARDYNPSPKLESIKARLLAINSADDERNPPELGIMEREIKRVKQGQYVLIPANSETSGHGTVGRAKWWKHHLVQLLASVEQGVK